MAKFQGLRLFYHFGILLFAVGLQSTETPAITNEEALVPKENVLTRACANLISWFSLRKQNRLDLELELDRNRLASYLKEKEIPAERMELQRTAFWIGLLDSAIAAQRTIDVLAPNPRTGKLQAQTISLSEMARIRSHLHLDLESNQRLWTVAFSSSLKDLIPLQFVYLPETLSDERKKELEEIYELFERVKDFYARLPGLDAREVNGRAITMALQEEDILLNDLRSALPHTAGGYRTADRGFAEFATKGYATNLVRIQELAIHHHPQAWENIVAFLTAYARDHFQNQGSEIDVRPMLDALSFIDSRLGAEHVFEDHAYPEAIQPPTKLESRPPVSDVSPTTDIDPSELKKPEENLRRLLTKSEILDRLLPLFKIKDFQGIRAKAKALDELNQKIGREFTKVTPRDLQHLKEIAPEIYESLKSQILLIMQKSHAPNVFTRGAPHASELRGFLVQAELDLGDDWQARSLFIR